MDREKLQRLRDKFDGAQDGAIHEPRFKRVAERIITPGGTRAAPYAGVPTLLSAPYLPVGQDLDVLNGLQAALIGVPMDLGVSNRNGARFGPRALRTIERIGPYNHVLDCMPVADIKVADIGDVPFRSRYDLAGSHQDIEQFYAQLVARNIAPFSVGGDHSITHPILRALGAKQPVGLVHIDAHCDTGGRYDGTRFHHGGPMRNAVLDGVLDPQRTIQIGIRGASEYLWEFSWESGMTVIHAEDFATMGVEAVIAKVREVIGDGPTYISFDIDGLDPAFAPGTGTPEVGGLSTREAQQLLRGLKGANIIGGDLVEVAPQYDATTNTAQAGGQMLFEILSLMCFSPALQGK